MTDEDIATYMAKNAAKKLERSDTISGYTNQSKTPTSARDPYGERRDRNR